jgi:hypothetical protein
MITTHPVANVKGCWYEVWIKECVLCGKTDIYKERRLPPKPELPECYHFEQTACSQHFL